MSSRRACSTEQVPGRPGYTEKPDKQADEERLNREVQTLLHTEELSPRSRGVLSRVSMGGRAKFNLSFNLQGKVQCFLTPKHFPRGRERTVAACIEVQGLITWTCLRIHCLLSLHQNGRVSKLRVRDALHPQESQAALSV